MGQPEDVVVPAGTSLAQSLMGVWGVRIVQASKGSTIQLEYGQKKNLVGAETFEPQDGKAWRQVGLTAGPAGDLIARVSYDEDTDVGQGAISPNSTTGSVLLASNIIPAGYLAASTQDVFFQATGLIGAAGVKSAPVDARAFRSVVGTISTANRTDPLIFNAYLEILRGPLATDVVTRRIGVGALQASGGGNTLGEITLGALGVAALAAARTAADQSITDPMGVMQIFNPSPPLWLRWNICNVGNGGAISAFVAQWNLDMWGIP